MKLPKVAQKWAALVGREMLVKGREIYHCKLLELSPSGKHLKFEHMTGDEKGKIEWVERSGMCVAELLPEKPVCPPSGPSN